MRALANDHRLLAHAAIDQPFAEQRLGAAAAIDEGRVEQIAACLEEGVEQDRARREGREILEAERHDRGRRARPGIARLTIAVPPERSGRPEIVLTRLAAFSMPYSSPTAVRHLSSTRRLPRLSAQPMPGQANSCRPARIASPAASASNEYSQRIFLDFDGLAAVRADDLDLAGAAFLAAGEPEILDLDTARGSEDAEQIVLVERDAAGDLGDDTAGKMQQRRRPFVDAGLAEMRDAGYLVRLGERLSAAAPAISRAIETG